MGPGNITEAIERERQSSRRLLDSMSRAIRRVARPGQIRKVTRSFEENTRPTYALVAGAAIGLLVVYWWRHRA